MLRHRKAAATSLRGLNGGALLHQAFLWQKAVAGLRNRRRLLTPGVIRNPRAMWLVFLNKWLAYRVGYMSGSPHGLPTSLALLDELRLAGFVAGQNLDVLEDGLGVADTRICCRRAREDFSGCDLRARFNTGEGRANRDLGGAFNRSQPLKGNRSPLELGTAVAYFLAIVHRATSEPPSMFG